MIHIKRRLVMMNLLILAVTGYELCYILYVMGVSSMVHAMSPMIKMFRGISLLFAVVLLLIGAIYLLPVVRTMKIRSSQSAVILMVVLLLMLELASSFRNHRFTIGNLGDMLIWPMLILDAYLVCSRYEPEQHSFGFATYLSELVLVAAAVPLVLTHLRGYTYYGMIVRPVYFCFALIPFVLIQKDGFWKNAVIVLVCLMEVASTKRAGAIACIGGVCVYYILRLHIEGSLGKKMKAIAKYIVVAAVACAAISVYSMTHSIAILERFANLSNDGGSGRLEIWGKVFKAFLHLDKFQQMIGRGYQAVSAELQVINSHTINAHNDFVEYLYDFGYVGLVLLVLLYVFLFVQLYQLWSKKCWIAPAYGCCLFMLLVMSMFSYGFVQSTTIDFLCIFTGCACALNRRKTPSGKGMSRYSAYRR